MTLITPDTGPSSLEAIAADCEQQLADISIELRDLMQRVRTGEGCSKDDVGKKLLEMRAWLKTARETEAQLHAERRKRCGIVGGYGLDLEQARFEVGCRLARLRRCYDQD
ncbi:hypothetical protein [Pseudoprimorskyibacter insulae]|uniref:hypothetical protein n=1 Tax=Pseudoprimorskyibacter insulae TaxID=1695997 RepID=UPI0015E869F4|nr:hypothetical protein [Pseudoprimorskyibacter insulae]